MKKTISSSLENLVIRKRDFYYVQETLNGSSRAFSKLTGFYYKRIFAIGMRFFHNQADAEDFAQNVFLKAYEKLSSFKGESLFSTWLTRIAFTTAMNQKERSHDAETLSDENLIPGKIKTPEEELIYSVRLYFFNGMSHEEISKATGIPVNTIKSHIFRAKKILGKKLEDYR